MSYHLRLCRGLSYSNGQLSATRKHPDAYTEDKATADKAVASGYFELVETAQASQEAQLDPEQLGTMTLANLKKLAKEMGLDVTGKDKESIIAAIVAEPVTPGEETGSEPDYGEGEGEHSGE